MKNIKRKHTDVMITKKMETEGNEYSENTYL